MLAYADPAWQDLVEKLWPAIAGVGSAAVLIFTVMVNRKVKDEEQDETTKTVKDLAQSIAALLPRILALEAQQKTGDADCEKHTQELRDHRRLIDRNSGAIERIKGRLDIH